MKERAMEHESGDTHRGEPGVSRAQPDARAFEIKGRLMALATSRKFAP